MSTDVQFIAFSEKEADAFWSSATVAQLFPLFEAFEQSGEDQEFLRQTLASVDLVAGGVRTTLEEGKHFHTHLESLTNVFMPDYAEKGWPMVFERELSEAPAAFYLALFERVTVEGIKDHFSDEGMIDSLVSLTADLAPVMEALDETERKLFININDELYLSPYFVSRVEKNLGSFEILYKKWKAVKAEIAEEAAHSHSHDHSAEDQSTLL